MPAAVSSPSEQSERVCSCPQIKPGQRGLHLSRIARRWERGNSLRGRILPVALSLSGDERTTVSFPLTSLVLHMVHWYAIGRSQIRGSSLRGQQLAHRRRQEERRRAFRVWFGPMNLMARQSTPRTGASIWAAVAGVITSLRTTPADRRT